jgi:hypothetical protein
MAASTWPTSVVGTVMCAIPRRVRLAATETTSEQTPPPNAIMTSRRPRSCRCANAATCMADSIVLRRSSSGTTSTATSIPDPASQRRKPSPWSRSTVGVITASARRGAPDTVTATTRSSPGRPPEMTTA